jgi:hypothetical protein
LGFGKMADSTCLVFNDMRVESSKGLKEILVLFPMLGLQVILFEDIPVDLNTVD